VVLKEGIVMLIVGLNGSPRREGNTAYLLRTALAEVEKAGVRTAFIQVSEGVVDVKVPFCISCSSPCEGMCYKGTRMAEMFDLLRRADGILIGSPVYFGTISAQLKAFWDKGRRLRYQKALLNVVGGAMAVGGARFGGQETTIRAIHDIMLIQGMTIVGDGHLHDDAGHQGVCAQRPSKEDNEALIRARILGRRVLEVAGTTAQLRSRDKG